MAEDEAKHVQATSMGEKHTKKEAKTLKIPTKWVWESSAIFWRPDLRLWLKALKEKAFHIRWSAKPQLPNGKENFAKPFFLP